MDLAHFLLSVGLLAAQTAFSAPTSEPSSSNATITTIYQFPNETWVENLAIRTNGKILATLIYPEPELWQVDPRTHTAELVHRFPNATSALGIAEIEQDVFAVIVGNWSTKTFASTPGSYSVWKVHLAEHHEPRVSSRGEVYAFDEARISMIGDVPLGGFLNGLTVNPNEANTVLLSDSLNGLIFRFDTLTAAYSVWLDDPAFKPEPSSPVTLGINGIQSRDEYLYFANSFANPVLGRVPISAGGSPGGPVEVILGKLTLTTNLDAQGDDFTFDRKGNVFLMTDASNEVLEVALNGSASVVAGGLDDAAIAGCTAARFGRTRRDDGVLYVTTNGGIVYPGKAGVHGGKIAAVEVDNRPQVTC